MGDSEEHERGGDCTGKSCRCQMERNLDTHSKLRKWSDASNDRARGFCLLQRLDKGAVREDNEP